MCLVGFASRDPSQGGPIKAVICPLAFALSSIRQPWKGGRVPRAAFTEKEGCVQQIPTLLCQLYLEYILWFCVGVL